MTNCAAISPLRGAHAPRVFIAAPRRNGPEGKNSRWRGRHRQHARRVRSPDSIEMPRTCDSTLPHVAPNMYGAVDHLCEFTDRPFSSSHSVTTVGCAWMSRNSGTYDFARNRWFSSVEAAFWARRLKAPSF